MVLHAELFAQTESLLRAGRIAAAVALLREVPPRAVPREHAARFANLCRRVGLVMRGLRTLAPVVRGESGVKDGAPRPEEWAEYAVLLQRSGAVQEALRIWGSREMKNAPGFGLQRALCHFNIWEHDRAIVPLNEALRDAAKDYDRLVIRVNLTAAHLYAGDHPHALKLARELRRDLLGTPNQRLLANAMELEAQALTEAGDFAAAGELLRQALTLLASAATTDQLFIRKGLAHVESFSTGDEAPLLAFRREALAREHFESVRDTDRLLLHLRFDEKRFQYLYFGTPWTAYRERLVRQLNYEPEESFFQRGPDDAGAALDLGRGEFFRTTGAKPEIVAGGKSLSLLRALGRDFYKPANGIGLFSEVYVDENFDPESSMNRVHQLLRRTRELLSEQDLPLWIEARRPRFRLRWEEELRVFFPRESREIDWEERQIRLLREQFGAGPLITTAEVLAALPLTPAQFRRVREWGENHGWIERVGAGAKSFYRLRKVG
ncbi:MAG: tetratricopeptide repeat protein [Bdellovibrionaceae bacterium]|nr:tetratricopeptide repeat protein [Pseudobdellovibrionaceae bacterium]